VVEFLTNASPEALRATSKMGYTLLHLAAAATESDEVVQCLVSVYDDAAEERTDCGFTPMDNAVVRGDKVIGILGALGSEAPETAPRKG
jgi:hypothetical protein